MIILVIKYGYTFRLFLSHHQANVVTEFRDTKCAPNGIQLGAHFIYHPITGWVPLNVAIVLSTEAQAPITSVYCCHCLAHLQLIRTLNVKQ